MTPRPAAQPAPGPLPLRLDGLSWDDLGDLLRDEWLAVHDGATAASCVSATVSTRRAPGTPAGRERRGLHRLGYRLQRAGDVRLWVWLLPEEPLPDPGRDLVASMRRWDQRSRLVRGQAVRTVRDVLGADVRAVSVDLLPEDDEAEEEEDDPDCWCGAAQHCGCAWGVCGDAPSSGSLSGRRAACARPPPRRPARPPAAA
jgi:hypothetical protein